MKKEFLAAMIMGSALMMCACGSNDNSDKATTTPAPNKVVNDNGSTDNTADTTEDALASQPSCPEEDESLIGAAEEEKTVAVIYDALISNVELQPMFEAPDDYVANLFGIDVTTLDDSVFYLAESEIQTETVIIVEVNVLNKQTVTDALNSYIEMKKAELKDYLPEQYDLAADAKVMEKDEYVYLVMSANADEANQFLDSNL